MKTKFLWVRNSFALITLAALISVAPAGAQTMTPQTPDSDTTRRQLAEFDRFLDNHPEVASQLRQDPSLVNNPECARNSASIAATRFAMVTSLDASSPTWIASSTAIPKSPSNYAKILPSSMTGPL